MAEEPSLIKLKHNPARKGRQLLALMRIPEGTTDEQFNALAEEAIRHVRQEAGLPPLEVQDAEPIKKRRSRPARKNHKESNNDAFSQV